MPKRVIINADDFGITRGVNRAIAELAAAKAISSTTVMANMDEYIEIAALKNDIGIGVHCNLTVGRPAAAPGSVPTLVNTEGCFFRLNELLQRMRQGKVSARDIAVELTAQLQRLLDLGISPDHFDSHQSLLKYPFFIKIINNFSLYS